MPQENSEPSANRGRPNQRQASPQREEPTQIPIWKRFTVSLLRGTIGILENTVEQLETETIEGGETNKRGVWKSFLAKVRQVVPGGFAARLTDPALTTIIIGIAIALVWTGNNLWHQQNQNIAEPPQEIAIAPEPTPEITNTPTATIPKEAAEEVKEEITKEAQETAENPPSTKVTESPEANLPEEITQPTTAPEDTAITQKSTTPPETVEIEPIEPELQPDVATTPIPETEEIETEEIETEQSPPEYIALTPEQNLIAAIENRIAEISDRITIGLVQSTQANFATSTLSVIISDEWYVLKAKQQDQIAADIWQNSQNLDFTHLEILDTQNRLVARNPVVGNQVIILQRHT